jgi:4-amino-4-deoxy-L-arabinose transferase-like glycosyltransferase
VLAECGGDLRIWALLILAGVGLRLAFAAQVPPVQLSDFGWYFSAAIRLVDEGRYYYPIPGGELLAGRPPGLPLLLAAFMWVFGKSPWIPLLINCLAFVITCITAGSLAKRMLGGASPLIVIGLLALWPGTIPGAGLAATEWTSLALLTTALWAFLRAQSGGAAWGYAILAGLCTGYGALVRPSLMLFPVVWLGFTLVAGFQYPQALRASVIAAVLTVAVIAPWSARNYRVLGDFVPISTNGGTVFYRANNPMATGGFQSDGERDLRALRHKEVLWNETGFSWGFEWIRENPLAFARLAVRKQALFVQHDSTWLYWTLERGHGYVGAWSRAARWISDGWFLCVLFLVSVSAIRARPFLSGDAAGSLLLATPLYLPFVHSVFESQARYHHPMMGVLAILAAMAIAPNGEDGANRRGTADIPLSKTRSRI